MSHDLPRISRDRISSLFDRNLPPVIHIQPGMTLIVETEDTRRGETRTPETTHPDYLRAMAARGWDGNPVTGPIFVEGAEPGDTLVVEIKTITCDTLGFTTNWPQLLHMADWFPNPETVLMPIADGHVLFDEQIRIPVRPMIGSIGVAPRVEVFTTGPSGRYGGNLDVPEVRAGSTIMFPVYVPGALLSLGDCHAIQNDGETRAVEMRAEVTITVGLHKGRLPGMSWPRIETAESIVTVGADRPLENALAIAVREMVLWVEALTGWSKAKCLNLIGLVADLRPGQAIPGITIPFTMRCIMPKSYLRHITNQLDHRTEGTALHE
jgi:acetamidase/formamidase